MIEIMKKFFVFAGERKRTFKQAIFLSILNSMFQALQIMAVYMVLEALVEQRVNAQTAWGAFGIMALSVLGGIFTKHNSTLAQAKGSFYMCADKRTAIADRMKYMPMGYFNSNSLGSITATVTSTMEDLQDIAPRVMDKMLHGLIHAGIITLMLLFFDWRIALIVIAGIILFFAVNALMQSKSKKISPARVQAQASLVGAILEYVQGMSVVRSFNLAHNANTQVAKAIEECERKNISLEMAFLPYMFVQTLLLKWVSVIMLLASVYFTLQGSMAVTACLMIMIMAFIIYSQLESAGSMSALMRSMDVSINRVQEISSTPVMDIEGMDIVPSRKTIEASHISFSYGNRTIIDDVSFSIPEGTTTAVIGPSGGGKTTLCNLITRFWDVDAGQITLGGRDVREYTLDSLLANFSMVFQSVYLFNDTIENNIKFGKPDATLEEVRQAARKACCDDFIMALPQGYDTVISEGGSTISGGEKQRISIARAILKDAPVIILDEATANVDPENEGRLQEAIAELTKNKTIIMIAHRLKTVQNADQILVLDQGKIIQRGTPTQLIAQDGIYKEFVGMREKTIGWKLASV
ncbi:MAG: ABC transporter ATP-binding protein [Lachnospiraceae bacterium]